ncbi:MAG: HEAT repeat domain-containing protein [Nitrospinae bacterium]|nr:HEAT repeat domain-containing protein [Nitrospinota bacterium]
MERNRIPRSAPPVLFSKRSSLEDHPRSQEMKRNPWVAIGFLALVSSVGLSIWAGLAVDGIKAPTRLVKGPDETVYVLAYDKIVKVSVYGDVLQTYGLNSDLRLGEPVADFYIEPNGDLLVGLADSQEIRIYSKDGKYLRTHSRKSSPPPREQSRDFRFTKDPESGRLYVADTFHNRIQIYGGNEKEISSLTSFLGIPLGHPNGMVFEDGNLFATDRDHSRVLVLGPDGEVKRAIQLNSILRSLNTLPLRISPSGENIFVLSRPPLPMPGREVHIVFPEPKNIGAIGLSKDPRAAIAQAMEMDRGPSRPIHKGEFLDLQDVLARADDVLIADTGSMKVLRFSHHGEALEFFGKDSLERVLSKVRGKRKALELMYPISIAGACVVLAAFLIALRRERKASASVATPLRPQGRLWIQELLGSRDSRRRKMLLVLLPCLGQVAVGKDFRAFLYLVPLIAFLSLTVELISAYFFDLSVIPSVINQVALITAVLCISIYTWVFMVVDALRLDRSAGLPLKTLPFRYKILWNVLPLVTAVLGAGGQFAQEYLVKYFPAVGNSLKTIFINFLASLKYSSLFAVLYGEFLSRNLIAWGTTTAFIFGSMAWLISSRKPDVLAMGFLGLISGALLWMVAVASCGIVFDDPQTGSLITFPVQGFATGLLLYLVAGPSRLSFLIIPAALSATWVGLILAAFTIFMGNSIYGASFIYMAVIPFVVHQAVLRVTFSLGTIQAYTPPSEPGRFILLKPIGWASLILLLVSVAGGIYLNRPMTGNQLSALTERLVFLRNTEALALEELDGLNDNDKLKLVPELISSIKNNPGPVAYYGNRAATALGRIGPIAVPQLIEALKDTNHSVRYFAAKSLGLMGPDAKAAVPALAANLKDKDDTVRYGTAEFLGMIGPAAEEAVQALIDTLRNDEYDLAREYAVIAIGKIGTQTPDVMSALVDAVRDPDHSVAHKAAEALSAMGARAVPELTELLKSPAKSIRYRAITALASIGPDAKQSGLSLLSALRDDDENIRLAAERALAKIDPNLTLPVNDLILHLTQGDEKKRISAAFALGKSGEEAATALIPLIKDGNFEIRLLAINALGMIGPPAQKAVPILEKLLKDKEQAIRGNAAWALGEIDMDRKPGAETVADQLAGIDKLVEGSMTPLGDRAYASSGRLLVYAIERLEGLEKKYPRSSEMDMILFMSGNIKSAIGGMTDAVYGDSPEKVYVDTHRDQYDFPYLAVVYKGSAFHNIIKDYPDSPWVDDAAFALAINKTKGGECESDFNCRVSRSVGALLPFIEDYPNSQKISGAVQNINQDILQLAINPEEYGNWVVDVTKESRQLLDEYHEALLSVPSLSIRSEALYPLAWTYLRDKQYSRADSIFKDLLDNYSNLENREDIEKAREELKALIQKP